MGRFNLLADKRVFLRVYAHGLSQLFRVADHVQHVVPDLKGQTQVVGIGFGSAALFGGAAAADHAQAAGGLDEAAGLDRKSVV